MSAHARYEDVLAVARRFGPSHILGTPSKLGLFARFLAVAGETLRVPHLLYAGELLRPGARAMLAETFGSTQLWSLYGGAESGIWGWCDVTRRPDIFRVLPGIVVEVPAPDADGFGPLAVTNGFRMRFPVFRYCVGDVGRFVTVEGERLLELRGRDSRSFQFAELTHDLDRIAALAEGAEGFQLQLRTGDGGRDTVALLLVDEREACAPEAVAAALAALLPAPPGSEAVTVRRVTREALHQDPATSKTPPIADFRR
jgi:phenylacetate-CoA ligase